FSVLVSNRNLPSFSNDIFLAFRYKGSNKIICFNCFFREQQTYILSNSSSALTSQEFICDCDEKVKDTFIIYCYNSIQCTFKGFFISDFDGFNFSKLRFYLVPC